MKKILILILSLLPIMVVAQNNIMVDFRPLPIFEIDSVGNNTFYYANSKGKFNPIDEEEIFITTELIIEGTEVKKLITIVKSL